MKRVEKPSGTIFEEFPIVDDMGVAIEDLVTSWDKKSRLLKQTELRRRIESRQERLRLMEELGEDPGEFEWE